MKTIRTVAASILIILFIFCNLVCCDLNPDNVVVAINCGGETFQDSKGVIYEKDNYFSGGQSSDFGANFEIKMTQDAELYQTERWAGEDFSYDIPVPNSGKYVLVLKFSEVYFNSPNEKIFNVALGKQNIVNNLDVFSKVGKAFAYDEFIEFELKNNKVYINGRVAEGAYNEETGILTINFIKGERDNPKINSILLVKGTLADTDYENFKNQFEELERLKQEKERKQREFKKKSNDYDYEDFEDDYIDSGVTGEKVSTFFSPTGIILLSLIGLFMYSLLFKSKKFDASRDD